MDKIYFGLLPYVGFPALFAIVGFACDQLFDDNYKTEIAQRIRDRRSVGSIQATLSAFNTSLVDRFFGVRIISFKFVVRSFVLSLSVLFIIILTQSVVYKSTFSQIIALKDSTSFEFAVLLVFFTAMTDYLCNVATIVILKMAAARGYVLDLVVSFIANMSLTMTIFTWVFPVGLVGCLVFGPLSPAGLSAKLQSIPATLLPITSASNIAIRDVGFEKIYRTIPFILTGQNIDQYNSFNTDIVYSVGNINDSDDDHLDHMTRMMAKSNTAPFSMRGSSVIIADIPVDDFYNARYLLSLYAGSFSATETVRSDFYNVAKLSPIAIRMSSIYALARSSYGSFGLASEGLALCENYRVLALEIPAQDLDQLIRIGEVRCTSRLKGALLFGKGGRISDELAGIKAADALLPLAAFFLSSFSISLFYYVGLTVTAVGLRINSLVTRIFQTRALNVAKLPFTFLGIIIFFVTELFWIPVRYFLL